MTPTPPSSGSGGPSSSADPGPPPDRERFVSSGWFDGLGELATGVEGPAPRLEKLGRPLLQCAWAAVRGTDGAAILAGVCQRSGRVAARDPGPLQAFRVVIFS